MPIQSGAGFVAGNRRVIAEGVVQGLQGFVGRMYDISPDGQRFVAIKAGADADESASPRGSS